MVSPNPPTRLTVQRLSHEKMKCSIFDDIGRLHVRYKTAVWLQGLIKTPIMRLPMPRPRLVEIEEITQALIRANLQVISKAEIQKT